MGSTWGEGSVGAWMVEAAHLGSTTWALNAQLGSKYFMLRAVGAVEGKGRSLRTFGFGEEGWDEPAGENP